MDRSGLPYVEAVFLISLMVSGECFCVAYCTVHTLSAETLGCICTTAPTISMCDQVADSLDGRNMEDPGVYLFEFVLELDMYDS